MRDTNHPAKSVYQVARHTRNGATRPFAATFDTRDEAEAFKLQLLQRAAANGLRGQAYVIVEKRVRS